MYWRTVSQSSRRSIGSILGIHNETGKANVVRIWDAVLSKPQSIYFLTWLDPCCSLRSPYLFTEVYNHGSEPQRRQTLSYFRPFSLELLHVSLYQQCKNWLREDYALPIDNKYSFHIFINHSERFHVFENQLDCGSDTHTCCQSIRYQLTLKAWYSHSDVGLHGAMCILWLLLYTCATENVLQPRFNSSNWLRLRYLTSSVLASKSKSQHV